MTRLFALGALGLALGAGVYAIGRAVKRRSDARRQQDPDTAFDYSDVDEPVIVEEVVIVTEPSAY